MGTKLRPTKIFIERIKVEYQVRSTVTGNTPLRLKDRLTIVITFHFISFYIRTNFVKIEVNNKDSLYLVYIIRGRIETRAKHSQVNGYRIMLFYKNISVFLV